MTVEECKIKFPIGSKVKRINGDHRQMKVSHTDIVTGYDTDASNGAVINLKKYGIGHDPYNFESLTKPELQINLW